MNHDLAWPNEPDRESAYTEEDESLTRFLIEAGAELCSRSSCFQAFNEHHFYNMYQNAMWKNNVWKIFLLKTCNQNLVFRFNERMFIQTLNKRFGSINTLRNRPPTFNRIIPMLCYQRFTTSLISSEANHTSIPQMGDTPQLLLQFSLYELLGMLWIHMLKCFVNWKVRLTNITLTFECNMWIGWPNHGLPGSVITSRRKSLSKT